MLRIADLATRDRVSKPAVSRRLRHLRARQRASGLEVTGIASDARFGIAL